MSLTVRTEGFRALNDALGEIERTATRRSVGRRALMDAAEPIEDHMRASAPDDPSTSAPLDLKASIARSTRQKSGRATKFRKSNPTEQVVHVGPTRDGYPQAMMQEFGTKHHAAQPYIRPAWDAQGGHAALRRIGESLGSEIERAARLQERRHARARKAK